MNDARRQSNRVLTQTAGYHLEFEHSGGPPQKPEGNLELEHFRKTIKSARALFEPLYPLATLWKYRNVQQLVMDKHAVDSQRP